MRIISIGIVAMVALAVGIASFDAAYAAGPCCPTGYRNGVYIYLKTGKPAPLPAAHVASPPKPTGGAAPSTSGGGGGHK